MCAWVSLCVEVNDMCAVDYRVQRPEEVRPPGTGMCKPPDASTEPSSERTLSALNYWTIIFPALDDFVNSKIK